MYKGLFNLISLPWNSKFVRLFVRIKIQIQCIQYTSTQDPCTSYLPTCIINIKHSCSQNIPISHGSVIWIPIVTYLERAMLLLLIIDPWRWTKELQCFSRKISRLTWTLVSWQYCTPKRSMSGLLIFAHFLESFFLGGYVGSWWDDKSCMVRQFVSSNPKATNDLGKHGSCQPI